MITLLSLIGCAFLFGEPPVPATCDEQFPDVALSACFDGPAADTADTAAALASVDWSGTVAEVGSGFPEACTAAVFGNGQGASRWWARIATVTGDVYVGIDLPGSTAPAVGTAVRVQGAYVPGGFGPTEAFVTLTAGDALLAWVGEAGAAEDLEAPDGYVLTQGDAVCSESDECGAWEWHDLDVAAGGASRSVAPGEQAEVGGHTVTVSDLRHDEGGTTCPDWFVASAVVGIAG